MARRLGKGYNPQDIRTATFKLSHEKWEKFQNICRGQNRSASDVLLEFVESVLNGDNLPTKDDGVTLAIANLEKEIAAINSRLDALESKDDGLPVVVELEPSQPIVEGQFPHGLNQSQLADRFGIRQASVGKQRKNARDKGDPNLFIEWSRGKDPDGLGWQFESDDRFSQLFPVPVEK